MKFCSVKDRLDPLSQGRIGMMTKQIFFVFNKNFFDSY
jgi:hypothetical protein